MSFALQSESALLGDVRHKALPFRIGTAGKALACNDAAEKIARAVAFGAMAETVDEIGAAIPLRRARLVGNEQPAVEEQQFPDADIAADVERERQVVIAHLAGDRRQRFQIGEEIADILDSSHARRTCRETPGSNAFRQAKHLSSPR